MSKFFLGGHLKKLARLVLIHEVESFLRCLHNPIKFFMGQVPSLSNFSYQICTPLFNISLGQVYT